MLLLGLEPDLGHYDELGNIFLGVYRKEEEGEDEEDRRTLLGDYAYVVYGISRCMFRAWQHVSQASAAPIVGMGTIQEGNWRHQW